MADNEKMTVNDLIATLTALPADQRALPVHIAFASGDYWNTTLSPAVSEVEVLTIGKSEYHGKPCLFDGDGDDAGTTLALVLF